MNLILLFTQIFILSILWILMQILAFKKKMNSETMNPFECGFNNLNNSLPLSIQFSLLVFIFLLFDVELSILITSNWKIKTLNSNWILMFLVFSISLFLSLIYEIYKKIMNWLKNS